MEHFILDYIDSSYCCFNWDCVFIRITITKKRRQFFRYLGFWLQCYYNYFGYYRVIIVRKQSRLVREIKKARRPFKRVRNSWIIP